MRVRRTVELAGHMGTQEICFLSTCGAGTEVNVVGTENYPSELGVRVCILDGETPTSEDR